MFNVESKSLNARSCVLVVFANLLNKIPLSFHRKNSIFGEVRLTQQRQRDGPLPQRRAAVTNKHGTLFDNECCRVFTKAVFYFAIHINSSKLRGCSL